MRTSTSPGNFREVCKMKEKISEEVSVQSMGEYKLIGIRVVCPAEEYIVEIPKATKVYD